MSTWDNISKSGYGQSFQYDELNMAYDTANDPDSGSTVYYNAIGTAVTITNVSKN